MKKSILFAILAASLFAVACGGNRQKNNSEPKSLVIYYSQTGTTEAVAKEIQRLTAADIERIDVENPYDGDYNATIERVRAEREANELPALKPMKADVANYDIIYIGYPIWFGTYAPPIAALVTGLDLEGKTVVPFCTFGSGGLEATVSELRAKFPGAKILDGYGVRTARINAMPAELDRFLKKNNLTEGEVEPLPEFSEQLPVGKEERIIFDMACGDYQFPLGTPVSFGTRPIADGTEYKFLVASQTPDGQPTEAIIYVTDRLIEEDMGMVEFTKVVR